MVKAFELRLNTPFEHVEPWLKEIEKRTDGRVKFTYYDSEMSKTIKAHTDLRDLVLNGTVDLNLIHTSYHTDALPLSGIFGLPFVYPSGEVLGAVGWELLQKYMLDTEYKDVKVLWLFVPGILELHFVSRPVHKLEDLKDMKIQMHGVLPPNAFKALGGCPVPAARSDVVPFLKKGLLDGLVMNWEGLINFGDIEVIKYSIANSKVWSTGMPIIMNLSTWNSLPPDIQQIFEDYSGLNMSRKVGATMDNLDRKGFEKTKEHAQKVGSPEIYYLPEDERARWAEVVQPAIDQWVADMEAKGLPGKAVLEDARSLVKKIQ